MKDLTTDEVADLFLSAQTISRVIEETYKCTSVTIACQDGKDAGQRFGGFSVLTLTLI